LKRTFRNDSIEDIFLYIHGYGYPGLRSGKSGLLEGGHSFNPTILFIVVGHFVLTASTISK
jgi:hypothetical protein